MCIDTTLSTPTVSAVEDAPAAIAQRAHAVHLQCVRVGIFATTTAISTSTNATGSVIGVAGADDDLRSVIVVRCGTGHVTRDM